MNSTCLRSFFIRTSNYIEDKLYFVKQGKRLNVRLQGRNIPVFILHKGGVQGKPTIAIDCGIHAREWISPAVCRLFIEEYLRCAQPDAADCDDSFDEDFYAYNFAMFPLLNQDGYYYTWSNDRLWRKNRTPSEDGPCIGTDLNRNADVAWGATGSSDNTCSQVGNTCNM